MAKAMQCDRFGEFYQEYGAEFVQNIINQSVKTAPAVEGYGERDVF